MKSNYKQLKQRDYNNQKQQKNLSNKKTKNKKRAKLVDFVNRKSEAFTNQKVKSLIDFDEEYSCTIRLVIIKKSSKITLTARFFSKVSIKIFAMI